MHRRTRWRSSVAATVSATSSSAGSGSAAFCSRREEAFSERTRSTARRCAMVSAQAAALPRAGSNRDAVRQISSSTSWATSSDWAGSLSPCRTTPVTGPNGAPVTAVGETAINLTPVPVKEFAIAHFGTHDKAALVTGIVVLLAAFAVLIGVLAVRRLAYGLVALAVFAAVGVAAAVS